MLSFTRFCTNLDIIKKWDEYVDDLYNCDIDIINAPSCSVVNALVETMSEALGDTGDWLAWWIWETNQGQHHYTIEDNGEEIDIKTRVDIYEFITGEKNDGE